MPGSSGIAGRIRRAIVTNWPIKITALVLSAVLWAAVAAEQPTTQQVPVDLVVEVPEGRTLNQSLPTIQATYAGPTRELLKLFSTRPIIRKTVPDTVSGEQFEFTLLPEDLLTSGDIDVRPQEVQPRVIVVTLDDVSQRTVRVRPRVRIIPDAGYTVVGGIGIVPSTVTIRGPESAVRAIREVPTLPLELRGVTEPVRRVVSLDTTRLGIARVTPREVEVSAEVAFVAERVLMGVPITVQSDGTVWIADPPAVLVTVRGPSARLVRLTRDSVSVVATPSGAAAPDTVVTRVVAPAGITATATPDSVVLIRPGG